MPRELDNGLCDYILIHSFFFCRCSPQSFCLHIYFPERHSREQRAMLTELNKTLCEFFSTSFSLSLMISFFPLHFHLTSSSLQFYLSAKLISHSLFYVYLSIYLSICMCACLSIHLYLYSSLYTSLLSSFSLSILSSFPFSLSLNLLPIFLSSPFYSSNTFPSSAFPFHRLSQNIFHIYTDAYGVSQANAWI